MVSFKAYVSPTDKLPLAFADFRGVWKSTLKSMTEESSGKLNYEFVDPEAGGGQLAQQLNEQYGFVPQIAGLFDTQPFWFYHGFRR